MITLAISPELELPLEDFLTGTQAIIAKKGKGKSYLASVEAEELLEADMQIVVLDPTGAWYGLRSSPDGRSTGYEIAILGGEHADVPLEPTAGEVVANAIATEHFSAIIDLTLFRKGEALRFCAAFLETLYRVNRQALHLFIDEADVVAPQKTFSPEQAKALGATEDIVRRGRIRGIGCTLISQRAQVINKDVLSQVDMLTALGMNHPKDLGAIDDWVAVHGDPKQAAKMIAALPSLPVGKAWIWAPGTGAGDIFECVTVRKRRTFDSGKTPKAGEKKLEAKVLAPVDLRRLGDAIAQSVERAKESDPKALRARVAELERQLAAKPSATPREVEVPVLKSEDWDRLTTAIDKFDAIAGTFFDELENVGQVVRDIEATIKLAFRLPVAKSSRTNGHAKAKPAIGEQRNTHLEKPAPPPQRKPASSAPSKIDGRAVLDALFALVAIDLPRTMTALAAWLGVHPKNGTLLQTIGALREDGELDGLEPKGHALGDYKTWSADEVRAHFIAGFSPSQILVLDTLATFEAMKRTPTTSALAARIGVHPKNGTLLKDLGVLRARGMLDGLQLTELGRRAQRPVAKKTPAEIIAILTESQQRLAKTVLERDVASISELAAVLGVHPKNGTLLKDIGVLRARGMVTDGWPLRPGEVLT